MNSLFKPDRMLQDIFQRVPLWNNFDFKINSSFPEIDIISDEKCYKLISDLPSFDRSDIEISIEENVLTFKGEHKINTAQENGNYLIKERTSKQFARSFILPKNVDTEAIKASFKEGVLEVTCPLAENKTVKKIEVN